MKKNEVPQDDTYLKDITREVCYALNEEGRYEKTLSTGWFVKHEALVAAWDDIKDTLQKARQEVINNEKSPIYYYMLLNLMDVPLLSSYTGFWKFFVKRHLKPCGFAKLNDRKLKIYADVFGITINELKEFKNNDK